MSNRGAWHPSKLGHLAGRTFVVTGANSGIGLEVTRELVGRGAHVVMAVRDTAKGETAVADLAGPGSTSILELDLSDLDQTAACAETLIARHGQLDALICNAGVMGGPRLLSAQGFERQMATNHLGHAALISVLWPMLHTSAARVVIVSSSEARGGKITARTSERELLDPAPYDGKQAYRNSKQANLLFAQQLHRRCTQTGSPVSVVSVHPGIAATNLLARQLDRAGRHRLAKLSTAITNMLLPTATAGAQTTLRALDPTTHSGDFIRPAQLGGFRGPPELREPYPSGADPATAARLWELTEQALTIPLPA